MRLFNSLTQQYEAFEPQGEGRTGRATPRPHMIHLVYTHSRYHQSRRTRSARIVPGRRLISTRMRVLRTSDLGLREPVFRWL